MLDACRPGGNARLGAAAERGGDPAAVGLVADDDDRVAAPSTSCADALGGRARREPLVGLDRERRAPGASSAPVSRARRSGLVSTASGRTSSAASRSPSARGRLAPVRRQRPQLVGLARRGLCMADEKESHAAEHSARRWIGWPCADAALRDRRRLHGHAARREPARRLHRRARPRDRADAAARARDEPLGDGLRAPAGERTGTRGSGSSRPRPSCRSPGTRRSGRRSCSPRRCSSPRSGSRRRRESSPSRSSAKAARIVFGRMEQPLPTWEPFADEDALLRGARRRAERAAGRALRQRHAARLRRARLRGRGRRAAAGLLGARWRCLRCSG